jgi:hypothetical protein
MDKETIVKILKEKIYDVEASKLDTDPARKIVIVHLEAEMFLKMAYLYVGLNS